jgi:predicted acylesterase/phospholipase RssA
MRAQQKTAFFQNALGVFQGGGCCGAAFAGAFESTSRHGVQFSEVAGTSAGSIVAAIVGAGAEAQQALEIIRQLDFKHFMGDMDRSIGRRRPILRWLVKRLCGWEWIVDLMCHRGLHSPKQIEIWVEKCLRGVLAYGGSAPVSFEQLRIPTSIVATDLRAKRVKVWSTDKTPTEGVAHAVSASCSIPLFFQPVDGRYVDGGALSNLPAFVFTQGGSNDHPSASRVLAFTLVGEERQREDAGDFESYLKDVASTIVEGSQDLQMSIQEGVHTIRINTGAVGATDFDKMTSEAVTSLIKAGQNAADRFFAEEKLHIKPPMQSGRVCVGKDEMYSAIVETLDRPMSGVLFVDEKTDWAYSLFPTLLMWRRKGIHLRILLAKEPLNDKHETYRRRLLRSMGADIQEMDSIPYRGFIADYDKPANATALIRIQSEATTPSIEAVRYDGPLDETLIQTFREHVELMVVPNAWKNPGVNINFAAGNSDKLLALLRGLPQYASATVQLTVEQIPLTKVIPLTKHVREYKYKQVKHLYEMYKTSGLEAFQTAYLAFADGKTSLVTPPVVEASGDGFVVIEGSTRMLFCKNEGINNLTCVVARNVLAPLPAARWSLDRVRIIGRTLGPKERYEDFNYPNFRRIEYFVHNPESYL